MKKSQPIRMCIACRSKHPQSTLVRLKQEGKNVIAYDGKGRSFYLCHLCIKSEKKIKGLVKRFKQNESQFTDMIERLTVKVSSCDQSQYTKGVN
ncbi:MAG: DUF448 domain-containing protein [Campylobacterota bacterium]|nr:DUF448 domain-containing protein [Campylobacterota bacterium]